MTTRVSVCPAAVNVCAVPGLAGRLQQRLSCRAPLADGLDQDRQDRQALAGAGVHA